MKNWKYILWIPAVLSFGTALLFPSIFKIENSAVQSLMVVIGLVLLVVSAYVLVELRRVLLYLALAVVFTVSRYVVVFDLWEPYPKIAMVMLPIVVLLAIAFWGLTAFEGFKILKKY